MSSEVQPIYFETESDFRMWLEKYHRKASELFVGFYKVGSGRKSMTWSQSVDQAICFGWIDGVRKSIDEDRYVIRFTPRKPNSTWSVVNIKKVDELTKKGLMRPDGLAAFQRRKEDNSGIYSYENQNSVRLSDEFEKLFKSNPKAWSYFQSLPPSYRKPAIRWVMSAKQETTRRKRLATLISDSEGGRKIKPLSY
ncbi:MAG TPA: YdeI/OmpD-associated family protein [Sunxiuqinia sp.]|nr:YdeI/OmpD-associated family protein [Sunxiuqinia sp.]